MSGVPMILFANGIPDVFRLSDIYDPDIHGADPDASGKQIPSTESLVVDDVNAPGSLSLWVVESVNPLTYKSTIVPIRIPETITDRVMSYGNDVLCLYYEPIAVGGRHRLVIDSKILMIGTADTYYQLFVRRSGTDTVISNYVNEDGELDGNYVPLEDTDETTGFRLFTPCVTGEELVDGDVIIMKVYRVLTEVPLVYELIGQYNLIAKEAHQVEDLAIGEGPVTAMTLESNQVDEDGNFIIYRGQSLAELAIHPYVHYANGHIESKPINNEDCFIYGLTDVDTDLVGMMYELLVKWFLPDNVPSPLADPAVSSRAVSATKMLVVRARDVDAIMKMSPILMQVAGVWDLSFIGTPMSRTAAVACTPFEYIEGTSFNPALLDTEQRVKIKYIVQDELGEDVEFTQECWITLYDTATAPWGIITDYIQDINYGQESSPYVTPTVEVNTVTNKCVIPGTLFPAYTDFIANFYDRALPPKFINEGVPPVPTHFNLKYASTGVAINLAPVAMADYDTEIDCVSATLTTDATILVEFLRQEGETMQYLYTVPAVVRAILPL